MREVTYRSIDGLRRGGFPSASVRVCRWGVVKKAVWSGGLCRLRPDVVGVVAVYVASGRQIGFELDPAGSYQSQPRTRHTRTNHETNTRTQTRRHTRTRTPAQTNQPTNQPHTQPDRRGGDRAWMEVVRGTQTCCVLQCIHRRRGVARVGRLHFHIRVLNMRVLASPRALSFGVFITASLNSTLPYYSTR